MAVDKPAPPSFPRNPTQEIESDELEEVIDLIEQARILFKERIATPVSLHAGQVKLSILIELGKIRGEEKKMNHLQTQKVTAMIDEEIRGAGIKS
jgi:hypothetical protein